MKNNWILKCFYVVCSLTYTFSSIAEEGALTAGTEKITFMEDAKHVYYIPGFLSGNNPQEDALHTLKGIFPKSNIEVRPWKSIRTWYWAVYNTNEAADNIVAMILQMTPEERSKTVLVGHSLGGRIVVRTMAKLKDKGIKVGQAFLLGSAIPNNDTDIAKGVASSQNKVQNLYYEFDGALRLFYTHFMPLDSLPLGCTGYYKSSLENYNDTKVAFIQPSGANANSAEDSPPRDEQIKAYFDYLDEEYGEYKAANAVVFTPDQGWTDSEGIRERIRQRRLQRQQERQESFDKEKRRKQQQVVEASIAEWVLHDANLIYLNFLLNKRLDSNR